MKWMCPTEFEHFNSYAKRLVNGLNSHEAIICEFNKLRFVVIKGDTEETIEERYTHYYNEIYGE